MALYGDESSDRERAKLFRKDYENYLSSNKINQMSDVARVRDSLLNVYGFNQEKKDLSKMTQKEYYQGYPPNADKRQPFGLPTKRIVDKPVQTLTPQSGDNLLLSDKTTAEGTGGLFTGNHTPPSLAGNSAIRFRRKYDIEKGMGYEQINPDGSIEFLEPEEYFNLNVRQPNYGSILTSGGMIGK